MKNLTKTKRYQRIQNICALGILAARIMERDDDGMLLPDADADTCDYAAGLLLDAIANIAGNRDEDHT